MGFALTLEEFTPLDHPAAAQAARRDAIAEAWNEGHAAGAQAGTEASAKAHADAQDRLRAEWIEVLRDLAQDRQEAQASVLRGIAPFVQTVIAGLAPRLAEEGLKDLVSDALADALRDRPEPVPVLRCAPEMAAALEPALAEFDGRYRLDPDPRLTPQEAELHWEDGFDALDPGAILRAAEAHLTAALAGVEQDLDATHTETRADVG
ncbi:MAG: hypothetical protein AAGE76_05825 [Pseudomonadota bacterium]